jgi:nitrogen PTS system EIIA component
MEHFMQLSDHLSPENVVLDLAASSKRELIIKLSDLASKRTGVEASVISAALTSRENLGSTGIGQGIAIPHAIAEGVPDCFCLFVRLAKPLDFEAVDDVPVDVVVLLLSPPADQRQNLNLLSCIARRLRNDSIADAVRSADTPEAAYILLTEA